MTISEYDFFGVGTAPGGASVITIFKGKHGEVWRHGDNYGSLGAGHSLCKEMAAEIERLRAELAAAKKHAAIGEAMERAAEEIKHLKQLARNLQKANLELIIANGTLAGQLQAYQILDAAGRINRET
jgi:hypothetical protein